MSTKQKVLALAATLGAEVDYGNGIGNNFEVCVDAPSGMHWKADGTHQLVQSAWDDDSPASLWEEALTRMSGGLEPCDSTCEE